MSQRKGWFRIDGVQGGDRTLEEQMRGVERALSECSGRRVLDLGAAEGLIAREFARAGAAAVHCVELLNDHLAVAREVCQGLQVTFEQGDLAKLVAPAEPYDIVLALGVAHKLRHPAVGIRYAARASRELVLVRLSRKTANGLLRSKHVPGNFCNVNDEMARAGYTLEAIEPGPREETVHYYRRKA